MDFNRQPIFKISVAQKLLRRGFVILDIARDKRNKEKTIFYFDKTPELYKAWKEIKEEETK